MNLDDSYWTDYFTACTLNWIARRRLYSSQTGLARQRWVSNTGGSNKEPVSRMDQQKGGFVRTQRTPPRSAPEWYMNKYMLPTGPDGSYFYTADLLKLDSYHCWATMSPAYTLCQCCFSCRHGRSSLVPRPRMKIEVARQLLPLMLTLTPRPSHPLLLGPRLTLTQCNKSSGTESCRDLGLYPISS